MLRSNSLLCLWHGDLLMKPTAKDQLKTANSLYREGRFGDAEEVYLKVGGIEPKDTAILMRLGEIALWKNRAEEAAHYFKEVLHNAPGLQKRWPFNIQLKAALAMAYYRQNRFPEAAQCFHEAAGPVSLGPFRDLKALGNQLALFGDQTPYGVEGPETTQIPFTVTDPLPVAEVSINGCKPVPFFIDTVGAEIILDPVFAEEIGAERAGVMAGEGGGTQGSIGVGKVDRMMIGDFTIKNLPIHILDMKAFASVFDGLPVKGIIGTRLLMQFLGTIDYVNACLILSRKTPEVQIDTKTTKVIPFWLVQTHYMVTWGTVNGKGPMLFFVDTGLAGIGFTAPEATLREAGIVVDWSQAQKSVGAFGETDGVNISVERLTLGTGTDEVVGHQVPGVVLKKPVEVLGNRFGFHIGGLVSHQFFRNYALTIDFVGMRLILQG
jgi:predicted aspartyl protease